MRLFAAFMTTAWIHLAFLMSPQAHANSQVGVYAGYDKPETGAEHGSPSGLLRFQLQTKPKWIRLQTAFNAAVGSQLMTAEFNAGPAIYPLSNLMEQSRIQPLLGAEGIGVIGSRDDATHIAAGYGIFFGVDLKIFSKKSGLSFMFELVKAGQPSIRYWLGFYQFSFN